MKVIFGAFILFISVNAMAQTGLMSEADLDKSPQQLRGEIASLREIIADQAAQIRALRSKIKLQQARLQYPQRKGDCTLGTR